MSATHMSWPTGPLYISNMPFYPLLPGKVFYVNSNIGADGTNHGQSWELPFGTIAYAATKCTANNGDIIFVAPGHAETIDAAAEINFNVAGVTVIGLGSGSSRPTITSSFTTSATVAISAANIQLYNLLFLCGRDSQIIMLDINSSDAIISNCVFRNQTSTQMITAIDINGGGNNQCNYTKIFDCTFRMSAVGSARAIELGEVADGVEIRRCNIWGDFDDACIHNPTGKILTNLAISDCELTNLQTGDHALELVSACTGKLIRNIYHSDIVAPGGVDPGSCFSFECYHDDVIDQSGILAPAAT